MWLATIVPKALSDSCVAFPHVHPMSRYVIAHDQFYQAFSRISILQATNAGVRRPGYKAREAIYGHTCTDCGTGWYGVCKYTSAFYLYIVLIFRPADEYNIVAGYSGMTTILHNCKCTVVASLSS